MQRGGGRGGAGQSSLGCKKAALLDFAKEDAWAPHPRHQSEKHDKMVEREEGRGLAGALPQGMHPIPLHSFVGGLDSPQQGTWGHQC